MFQISVPASSANLGPGFDTIGIALDLRLRATVTEAREYRLTFSEGPHAPTHPGFAEEIERGLAAILGSSRPLIEISRRKPDPARQRARLERRCGRAGCVDRRAYRRAGSHRVRARRRS